MELGGQGVVWDPSGTLRKFLGFKEHLNWLKIDLNAAEIITIQDYKHAQNWCEWKYTYKVLKLRVKQLIYDSNI